MLNTTGETPLIGSNPDPNSWVAGQIMLRMADFLESRNALQNSLSRAAETGLDAWTTFYTSPIDLIAAETHIPFTVSLGAGLEFLMSELALFDAEVSARREVYNTEDWLEAFLLNSWLVVPKLFGYTAGLYEDKMAGSQACENTLELMIYITLIVNILWAILYIILFRLLWLKWICIGKALAQLPKSQIHACIARLSSRRELALIGDERLYYNDCVKMVSAAGGFSELPVLPMTALLIVILVTCVLAVASVRWTLGNQLITADSVFMRDTLLSNMTSYANHVATELCLYVCRMQSDLFNQTNATIFAVDHIPMSVLTTTMSDDLQALTFIIDETTLGSPAGNSIGMLVSQ
jgi:hypothetical protein